MTLDNSTIIGILSEYPLNTITATNPFTKGAVQTNILIETSEGKYVLRYYRARPPKVVPTELELLEHLSKKGIPCQEPLITKDGKDHLLIAQHVAAVFKYIEGDHIPPDKLTNSQLKQIASLLAKIHNETISFKPKGYEQREIHDRPYIDSQLGIAKKAAKKEKYDNSKSIELITSTLDSIQVSKTLPYGMIHGDYDMANILFKKGKIGGIIDFDDSSYEPLLFDIADLLKNYCFRSQKSFNLNRARFLLDEYQKIRELNQTEKKSLYDIFLYRYCLFSTWTLAYAPPDKSGLQNGLTSMMRRLPLFSNIPREEFYKAMFS
ncbi:homoserine kinase [Candidatus Woesearchaeota archaeon]|nr:homoserine kinase [Candidatus Woesearchaeota archaeon]